MERGERKVEWKFAKMARNVSRDRSCLAEFFNDSTIFKDFTDALIREDIQNRLDAKRDDVPNEKPVVVTYHLTTDAEKDVVIDLAVKTFCEHHQMIALSRDAEGGDDE